MYKDTKKLYSYHKTYNLEHTLKEAQKKMNDGRRMVFGFAFLITFLCVLGGINFFQISEMDKYKDLPNIEESYRNNELFKI